MPNSTAFFIKKQQRASSMNQITLPPTYLPKSSMQTSPRICTRTCYNQRARRLVPGDWDNFHDARRRKDLRIRRTTAEDNFHGGMALLRAGFGLIRLRGIIGASIMP
eukprot:gene317-1777_t